MKYKNSKTLITITTGGGRGISQENIQSIERLGVEDAWGEGGRVAWGSKQAMWWCHLTNIMLRQSAQASRFPIGEHHVSRHQKIIIIGQTTTTGATSIHCCEQTWEAAEREGRAQLSFSFNEFYVALPISRYFVPLLAAFIN